MPSGLVCASSKYGRFNLDWPYPVNVTCQFTQTHIDIIEDFDHDLVEQLQALSQKHDFLIFEDRKFADIGMLYYLNAREILDLIPSIIMIRKYRCVAILARCPPHRILVTHHQRPPCPRARHHYRARIYRPTTRSRVTPPRRDELGWYSRCRRIHHRCHFHGTRTSRFRHWLYCHEEVRQPRGLPHPDTRCGIGRQGRRNGSAIQDSERSHS